MAIVVEHEETQTLYVLVGSGYGLMQGGGLLGGTTSQTVMACCDKDGVIHWFESDELLVVMTDGEDPEDVLDRAERDVYISDEDAARAAADRADAEPSEPEESAEPPTEPDRPEPHTVTPPASGTPPTTGTAVEPGREQPTASGAADPDAPEAAPRNDPSSSDLWGDRP